MSSPLNHRSRQLRLRQVLSGRLARVVYILIVLIVVPWLILSSVDKVILGSGASASTSAQGVLGFEAYPTRGTS